MKIEEKAKKWAEDKQLQDDTKERWAAHGFEEGMRHGLKVAVSHFASMEWGRTPKSWAEELEGILNGTRDLPEIE